MHDVKKSNVLLMMLTRGADTYIGTLILWNETLDWVHEKSSMMKYIGKVDFYSCYVFKLGVWGEKLHKHIMFYAWVV